jgi:hypothetical protein
MIKILTMFVGAFLLFGAQTVLGDTHTSWFIKTVSHANMDTGKLDTVLVITTNFRPHVLEHEIEYAFTGSGAVPVMPQPPMYKVANWVSNIQIWYNEDLISSHEYQNALNYIISNASEQIR